VSNVSEDIKFPHAVVVNRNLIAMLLDSLVEEGVISAEVSERIIEQALGIEPQPDSLNISTGEAFVRDIFKQGDQLGLTPKEAMAPANPVCDNCGAIVTPDQKFCTSCGHKLF